MLPQCPYLVKFRTKLFKRATSHFFNRPCACHFIPPPARIIASPANFVPAPLSPPAETIPASVASETRNKTSPAPPTMPATYSALNFSHIVSFLLDDAMGKQSIDTPRPAEYERDTPHRPSCASSRTSRHVGKCMNRRPRGYDSSRPL